MTTSAAATPLPDTIRPTEVLSFCAHEGPELYGEWFKATGATRGICLILHGYAEHCGRYREVAAVAVAAGYDTLSFDFRGHGRSDGHRGHVDRWTQYSDDIDAAMEAAWTRSHRELPVVWVGHSAGALATLQYLVDTRRRCPSLVAAVLSSPFLAPRAQLPLAMRALGHLASRWLPTLALPQSVHPTALTTDPGKIAERQRDTLCHDVGGARWFTEARAAQAEVAERAHRIRLPTLWLVGSADPITCSDTSFRVARRLGCAPQYHALEGFRHEVFNERDRASVFALLRDYLETHAAPAP